jgi:hypothetical protein
MCSLRNFKSARWLAAPAAGPKSDRIGVKVVSDAEQRFEEHFGSGATLGVDGVR